MEFNVVFGDESQEVFEADLEFSNTVAVGSKDHRELEHRDADDQHPMSAITGLEKSLEKKVEEGEILALSNQDIENLINSFV